MALILVADDDADIRELIEVLLTRDGHDVVTAADGAEAIVSFDRADFDLVVTDLNMPVVDGVELTQRVRAHARGSVPILLVTASAAGDDLVVARMAGISGHLTKPFQFGELRSWVAVLLPDPCGE